MIINCLLYKTVRDLLFVKYRHGIYIDEFVFSLSIQYACPFILAKTNFSCIYSLVDNACDMNIPVMKVNGIELTAKAEQG